MRGWAGIASLQYCSCKIKFLHCYIFSLHILKIFALFYYWNLLCTSIELLIFNYFEQLIFLNTIINFIFVHHTFYFISACWFQPFLLISLLPYLKLLIFFFIFMQWKLESVVSSGHEMKVSPVGTSWMNHLSWVMHGGMCWYV